MKMWKRPISISFDFMKVITCGLCIYLLVTNQLSLALFIVFMCMMCSFTITYHRK